MTKKPDDMTGGMILEDGLHPDNPDEREWIESMQKAEMKARLLYPEEDDCDA